MNKSKFSFIAIALLCAVTLITLSSCETDDAYSESDNVEGVSQITIGGKNGLVFYNTINRNYHTISKVYVNDDRVQFDIVLYDGKYTIDYGDARIGFIISPDNFKSGTDVTNRMNWFHFRLPSSAEQNTHTVNGEDLIVKSGKAVITSVNAQYATVKFSNYVVKMDDETCNIDGSATCEIQ